MTDEYINQKSIKERGWTQTAINKFLGEPDKLKQNPIYKAAAPQKQYLKNRVLAVEETKEYKEWLIASLKRKEAAKKSTETKKKALISWAESVSIELPELSRGDLFKRAIRSYNNRERQNPESFEFATMESDSEFLHRITVNYLRHCETDYEELLHKTHGKVGTANVYQIIKSRVLRLIAEEYPYLSDAAKAQEKI